MKHLLKFSLSLLLALVLFSCSKENEKLNTPEDSPEEAIEERKFQFEKCSELSYGDYTVTYCIQSDIEEEIDKVLAQKPYIEVTPYNADNTNDIQATEELEIDEETTNPYDVAEVIKESNIPTGYQLQVLYEKPHVDEFNKSSVRNRYFINSGARGIEVTASGNKVLCYFYSRGCCWYSFRSWYYRGRRTMGPRNTYFHRFKTTNYTTYYGAKMRGAATIQAWNAMQKTFIY